MNDNQKEFYNPYAFIPVTGKVNGKDTQTQAFAEIKQGENEHIRHDLYASDAFSGRIVCEVTLKTPTIVGGHRTPGDKNSPAILDSYCIDKKIAIPANSLRGMVATVAEALSQSALRVLYDSKYQVKKVNVEGSVYLSFKLINNADEGNRLLPWGAKSGDKPSPERPLTPAECLFGAVSEQKQGDGLDSHNLASRVRFYDGLFFEGPKTIAENVLKILASPKAPGNVLKILASPKAPSPAMYFNAENNPNIKPGIDKDKKPHLNLNKHKPNGRKYYLHHPEALSGKNTWETNNVNKNAEQKTKCELLKPGEAFYFHIDCMNLTSNELGLFFHALEPGVGFSHRLGLGKPLGLGSVKLKILGLFRLDAIQRYSVPGLDAPRYTKAYRVLPEKWRNADLRKRYTQEAIAVDNPEIHEKIDISTEWIDADTLNIVKVLGNQKYLKEKTPVCYPIEEGVNPGEEKEGFAWFRNNDSSPDYQILKTEINKDKLTPLKSNKKSSNNRRHRI